MKIPGIIIHCSDSPQGRGDNAETIHRWHLERGFSGIGYHYVILEDGTIENGRPHYWKGAHASGYNDYLGICLIGVDNFTDEQFTSLAILITNLKDKYNIDNNKIIGHYMVGSKTCPNFSIAEFKERYSL